MEYFINAVITFALYLSVPLSIRFIFLRRPIFKNWVVICILTPLFIVFALLLNVQRDQAKKKLAQEIGISYKANPHMIGSPILYLAMALSYTILRKKTKNQSMQKESALDQKLSTVPVDMQILVDEDRIYNEIASELETGIADKGLWTRIFAECGGDVKQTKVFYIKQRAGRLITAEREALERSILEQAAEAERIEKMRPPPTNEQLMEMYGITFDGEHYSYRDYKYGKLLDAVNYAKIDVEQSN